MKSNSLHSRLIREIETEASKCARCGACQSVCPVFQVTKREQGVARGKIALAEAFLRNEVCEGKGLEKIINNCLLCLACKENCPNNVDTELIIRNFRAVLNYYSKSRVSSKNLWGHVFKNSRFLESALKLDNISVFEYLERVVPAESGIRLRYPFSLLFDERLTSGARPLKSRIKPEIPSPDSKGKALFFVGCTTQYLKPEIGLSAIDLMNAIGYCTVVPESQECCGFAASVSGNEKVAADLENKLIKVISENPADFVVTVCPTCNRRITGILKKTGYELPVYDISKFIAEYMKQHGGISLCEEKLIVTYHDSCHLSRGLGIRDDPRYILNQCFGNRYREMEHADSCCGMGGLYGVTHPDISKAILKKKIEAIRETGCDYLFTGCPACILQLEDGVRKAKLGIEVKHLVQLVDFAESS